MAIERERPYAQFNFLVDLGDGTTDGARAGFEEVSGLSSSVDVIEYRNGNAKENSPIKITGLNKVGDVTLQPRSHRCAESLPMVQRHPQW